MVEKQCNFRGGKESCRKEDAKLQLLQAAGSSVVAAAERDKLTFELTAMLQTSC